MHDGAGQLVHNVSTVQVAGVSQVTRAPDRFAPGGSQFTRITVTAATGLALDARVFNTITNALTTTLPFTEASGTYAVEWDGRDQGGNFAGAATYRIQVFHRVSGQRYAPETSVIVDAGVFSVSGTPDPFVPTGQNSLTVTTQATAALTGLTAGIIAPSGQFVASGLPLIETGSVGTYLCQWNGQSGGSIVANGIYTIRIFDGSGNQFPSTGTITISSARVFTVSPNPFEPGSGRTAMINAQVAAGLELEARIGTSAVIPLVANGDTYSAAWQIRRLSRLRPGRIQYSCTIEQRVRDTASRRAHDLANTTPPETTITGGPAEGSTSAAGGNAYVGARPTIPVVRFLLPPT